MSLMQKMKSTVLAAMLALVCAFGGGVMTSSSAYAQDPAAAPAAEAPLAAAKTESVENPYGIGALWAQGDFVARFVLVAMLIMSGATWYIMVVKYIDQSKLMRQSKAANATFWKSASIPEGIKSLGSGSPFWYIADRGVSAQRHHEGTLVEQIDLSSWVTMSVNRAVDEIQSRLQ
ncbi:MAG: exbB, partial [Hydrocarboniphaga sp.]|nr:exbB [Hydrocarboniphaga sp.]